MIDTRRTIGIGLLTSIGIIMHFVENMIPLIFVIPGAKIGLANIVSLIGLVIFGFRGGLAILLLRLVLGSLLAGTFMTIKFYLSITGGLLSFLIMSLFFYYFKGKFSIIGISIIGAVFHNIGQLMTVYYLIENRGIFYYMPYLVLFAIPTGIGVGLIVHFTMSYLPFKIMKGDI